MTVFPHGLYQRGFRLTTSGTLLLCLGLVQWPLWLFRPARVLAATNTCQIPQNQRPSNVKPPQLPTPTGNQTTGNQRPSPLPMPDPPTRTKSGGTTIHRPDKDNAIANSPIAQRQRSGRLRRYRLGPGDRIYIDVQPFTELSQQTVVNPEGSIVIPLLGAISVSGLTPAQAQQQIQVGLNQYLVNPAVSLQLLVPRPINVTITGEVARPGFYPVAAQEATLATLLATAGGANPDADLRRVRLRWTESDGIPREQTIDLLTPLTQGQPIPDVNLEHGDAIVVPKRALGQEEQYDRELIGRSNLVAAPAAVEITVLGEVAQPGFYILPPSVRPLADALLIAGGATPSADLRCLMVRRLQDDGSLAAPIILDIYNALQANGETLPDFPLSNGDVVIVPKLPLGDRQYDNNLVSRSNLSGQQPVQINIVGEVTQPGYHILPASLRPLPDALLTAGGATPAADLQNIQVRRLLGDGTISEETIDLYTPLINGQELPSIRLSNGDVVVVPKRAIADNQDYDNNLVGQSNLAAQQPVQITVLGEVTQPGFHILPASLRPLPDALLTAGGASPTADLKNIQVRRLLGDGTISEETIDLYTPLINGQELPSIRLSNGDVVVVPKRALGEDSDYDNNLVGQSNLAAQQPVEITVLGEVAQPGFHLLSPAPRPLANALLTAGGTSSEADLRSVRVRRLMSDGSISEEVVDLFTPLQTGGELPSLRLGNGDVVYVPKIEPGTDEDYDRVLIARSTLANPEMTIRILSYPGQGANLITLRNGSTFSEILNTIPLSEADLRDIAVIRFDPEQGRAVTRKVDVKKLLEGDNSQNIPLQNNDVVVIGRNLLAKLTYSLNTFTQPFRDVLGFLLFFDQLRSSADALFGPGSDN